MKLYEITAEMEKLCDTDAEFDDHALATLSRELAKKTDSIGAVIRTIDADIDAIRAEEKRLAAMRKALENRQQEIKGYVLYQMREHDLTEFKGKLFKITRQSSPPSLVIDIPAQELPPKFITVVPEQYVANKDAIKEALKNGEEIKGCHLQTGEHIRIR